MYEPSRLVDSFGIAGFKNYDGATVLCDMKPGETLQLTHEADNPYDPNAVVIKRGGVKLGYVPQGKNDLASLLLFYGHDQVLECRVQKVDPVADTWNQVHVGIYVTDNRPLLVE